MVGAPVPPCSNPESFCLMWYGVGSGRVRIWNSRDGVTPFYIDADRKHEDWSMDEFSPWHLPRVGDQVFVDLTLERATSLRKRYVERWWDEDVHGTLMSERYPSKEEAVRVLAAADVGDGHNPALITLDDAASIERLVARSREQVRALGLSRHAKARFA